MLADENENFEKKIQTIYDYLLVLIFLSTLKFSHHGLVGYMNSTHHLGITCLGT
jgi:hypothetical protein